MLNTLHLDADGKTARVSYQSLPAAQPKPKPRLLTSAGEVVTWRVTNGVNPAVDPARLAFTDIANGDPEILPGGGELLDPDSLTTAFFDPGQPTPEPARDFKEIDVVYDVGGKEKERRPHIHRKRNLDDIHPVKTGKRYPIESALTSFVFRQVYQLVHEDGLTRDFLFGIARQLHDSKEMVLLGAGPKGNQPLVIREDGTPFRAFLYGETGSGADEGKYKLLLLLTDQELKRPAAVPEEEQA